MGSSAERHEWLEKARGYCTSLLAAVDCKVPTNVRVTIGFPSTGGRGKTIGQCVYDEGVSDDFHEVFVSPVLNDGVRILDVLTHELVHAANPKAKHGKAFKRAAVAVGLEGKMTATHAGEALKAKLEAWVEETGPYPAGAINLSARKKQKTYLLKAECETCGYTVRVTGKWVDEVGPPHCPDHGAMTVEGLSETDPTPVPEREDELPEREDDFILTGYRVTQDPARFEVFASDERSKAEAKARQWSKTGGKMAVCEAHLDGAEIGTKLFTGGLACPASEGYPLPE